MKTIGRFLSVFWQAIRSARLLFAVYTYMLGAYGVAFLYLLHFTCNDKNECKQDDIANITTVDALTTFTSTYFMTVCKSLVKIYFFWNRQCPINLYPMCGYLPFSRTPTHYLY